MKKLILFLLVLASFNFLIPFTYADSDKEDLIIVPYVTTVEENSLNWYSFNLACNSIW